METRRTQFRRDNGYECRISLDFRDIDSEDGIEYPVPGELRLTLGGGVPHPVELGIDDIEDENGNAEYVEFESRAQTVNGKTEYPVVFPFTTHPSSGKGGKWYFYKTADWTPDPNIEPYENPEFVKHHVAIPSAQKIRLIHHILNGEAGEDTISDLMELYDQRRTQAASEFSDNIKGHVGFESRTEIQNFLMQYSRFHRSHSDAVNKVAKQLVKEEYRHRVRSIEDLENMVETVNNAEHFPDITTEEVFQKVVGRSNERELREIADHLDLDDWSVVFSP